MEKVIHLSGQELRLHSSLFTIIEYRNVFGTELFHDIQGLSTDTGKHEEGLSLIVGTIFRIIYILQRPFNNRSYNEFLMTLDFSVLSNQEEIEKLTQCITEMLGGMGDVKSAPQSK